ncbi:MAG: glycosyltransferase family 39 protein [Chloroflexi bacterium]|nr:glycosyltransferase family 39 protein [Chloroflexota bacterium]
MDIEADQLSQTNQIQPTLGVLETPKLRLGSLWRTWGAISTLLTAIALFNLVFLMRFPAPFVDEGWNASRAWALIRTGRAFGTLDAGVFQNYDGYWTYFPWLAAWIHSLFMRLFGAELFSLRVASLFFGIVLLASVYSISNRLYGSRVGLFAVILLSFSESFLLSSHLGRHDIIIAAFGFGAVALYVTDDAKGFSLKSVMCGLAVGLTLDIHFNGLIFGPAIGALYLLDNGWRLLRNKRFWGFVLGAGAGLLFFVVMQVLPYPKSYFAIASLGNGSRVSPPIFTLDPALWLGSIYDTLTLFGFPLLILVAMAFAALVYRHSTSDKRLLVLFAALLLTFALVIRNKVGWYVIDISPALYLVVGAFLGKISEQPWRAPLFVFARACFAFALALATVALALMPVLTQNSNDDYQAALALIKRDIPPQSKVTGPQTYWFALPDASYLSWDDLAYRQRYYPGSTLEDAFRAVRPDYFIMDGWLDYFVTDDPARLAQSNSNTLLSKAALQSFLARYASRIDEIQLKTFGDLRIYKINWANPALIAPASPDPDSNTPMMEQASACCR